MIISGKRSLTNSINNKIKASAETLDAILIDVLTEQRICRVRILGSSELIIAYYPENWEKTPWWLKPRNSVKIMHTGGIRGRIEIIGCGLTYPMPISGSVFPDLPDLPDAILEGCRLIECPNDPQMIVLVTTGTYRISGTEYILDAIKMSEGDNFILGMGGTINTIAGAIEIDDAPTTGYRYDLIVVASDGIIDYVKGTASLTPELPDLPSGHIMLGYILLYTGMTEIRQNDINHELSTALSNYLTINIADNELSWSELTTNVTVYVYDQYGNNILKDGYGWYITLEIVQGNGSLTSDEEGEGILVGGHTGALSNFYTFLYTREQLETDQSVILKATLETNYLILAYGFITLLDESGDIMIG